MKLPFFQLIQCFAVDALICRWSCLESTNTNFNTASLAVAVVILIDKIGGFFDLSDQLAFTITGPELQTKLFFLASAVRGVGVVSRFVLHVTYRSVDFLH